MNPAPAMEPRDISNNPSKIASVSLTLILSSVSTDVDYEIWPMDKVQNNIAPLYTQTPYGVSLEQMTAFLYALRILKKSKKNCGSKYSPDHSILSSSNSVSPYLQDCSKIRVQGHFKRQNGIRRYFIKVVEKDHNDDALKKILSVPKIDRAFTRLFWRTSVIETLLEETDNSRTSKSPPKSGKDGKMNTIRPHRKRRVQMAKKKLYRSSTQLYRVGTHVKLLSESKFKLMNERMEAASNTIEEMKLERLSLCMKSNVLSEKIAQLEQRRRYFEVRCSEKEKTVQDLQSTTNDLITINARLKKENEQLKSDANDNAGAAKIGAIILLAFKNLNSAPCTALGSAFYMSAWTELPKGSANALAISLPLFIAGFFAEIGIFQLIPNIASGIGKICPSPNTFHKISRRARERTYQNMANVFTRQRPVAVAHDKALQGGVSRLCCEMSFSDEKDDGLPKTLRMGSEGSHGSSEEVAGGLKTILQNISAYTHAEISVCGFTTDSGGGGVGWSVVECAKQKMMASSFVFYWMPCIMHALNRALQVAVSNNFGTGGRQKVNPIQFAHTVWTVQQALGEDFYALWDLFVTQEATHDNEVEDEDSYVFVKLMKPLLTRWGHVTRCLNGILQMWDKWTLFLEGIWMYIDGTNRDMAGYSLGCMKSKKMKCEIMFIVTFARVFFNEHFSWLHHINPLTKRSGHISHEVPLRVAIMFRHIEHLRVTWRDPNGDFKAFHDLLNNLPDDEYNEMNTIKTKGGRETMLEQIDNFFSDFIATFQANTSEWQTQLLPFVISSSNSRAAQMFAQIYCYGKIDEELINDDDLCCECCIHQASLTAHAWADYLKKWEKVEDAVLEKHKVGVEMVAKGEILTSSSKREVLALFEDVKMYQWIQKSHTQSTERCVNFSGYLARNNKSETDAATIFAWSSLAKTPVEDIVRNHLRQHRKSANQHVGAGVTNRLLKTKNAKINSKKRKASGNMQDSRVYPTAFRSTVQIGYIEKHVCPSNEVQTRITTELKRQKQERAISMKGIRINQTLSKAKGNREKNEKNKEQGKKYRDPLNIKARDPDLQEDHCTPVSLTCFGKEKNREYLLKELQARSIEYPPVIGRKKPTLKNLRILLMRYEVKMRKESGEDFDASEYEQKEPKELLIMLKKTKLADFILMKHEDNNNNNTRQSIRANARRGQ